ncbi:MAG: energy transducer TonB [Gammaproteobacteria bacterium]|nr:energy transducer TonB [Gammaproteobacteria bacterium]
MSEQATSPSVLLISDDSNVVEAIINGNTTDLTINARESVGDVLKNQELLENNAIVILDCDSCGSNIDKAISQAIDLKKADPTQVLMLTGQKEFLAEILKSNIQPIVYRAFNKPIGGNQVFLAFKSALSVHDELVAKKEAGEDIMLVGPAENRANLDQLAAQQKTNPAIYAALGIVVLALVAFLFLGGDEEPQPQIVVDNSLDIQQAAEEEINQAVSRTNELNQLATNAILDGRYIQPAGDNALEYYNQALEIDPYDTVAYEGKKTIAAAVRTSYDTYVADKQFDKALGAINALRQIEPLNLENDLLAESLGKEASNYVKQVQATGTKEEVDAMAAVISKLGELDGDNSASKALEAEQDLLAKIDEAIASGNLVPPKKGNAYQMVSSALKGNKISRANSEPRVELLSGKLLALANTNLGNDKLDEAVKLSALVKRINLSSEENEGLSKLNADIKTKQEEIAAANAKSDSKTEDGKAAPAEQVAKVETKPEPPKIIPAKVIKRAAPRYPSRALKKGTEGWVKVSFGITKEGVPVDIKVVESEPVKVFDDAAIKSVKKWRFSPARNQRTGMPVDSKNISTKVQFRLN